MKKVLSLALAAAMALFLTACTQVIRLDCMLEADESMAVLLRRNKK